MKAKIINIKYIRCQSDSYIKQGYKRGQYPQSGIYHGGCGTYRVIYSTPADIEVEGVDDYNRSLYFKIGDAVRRLTGCRRLTWKFFCRVRDAQPYEVYLVRCGNRLEISESSLVDWLQNV